MEFINTHEEIPGHTVLEDGQPRRSFVVAGHTITAASLIVTRIDKDHGLQFLLVNINTPRGTQFQSLGGKVGPKDLHWKMTAMREFLEETGYCLDSAHIMSALMSTSAVVVHNKQSRHLYMFFRPGCSEKCTMEWGKLNKNRMSPEDKERVLQVKWLTINECTTEFTLRPDVKSAITFFVEAFEKQNNEQ